MANDSQTKELAAQNALLERLLLGEQSRLDKIIAQLEYEKMRNELLVNNEEKVQSNLKILETLAGLTPPYSTIAATL